MEKGLLQLVWVRAGDRCEYCRLRQAFDPVPFQVDHIIAQQHRGQTIEANLALACFSCNRRKGPNIASLDGTTGAIVPLFNPRADVWESHFEWQGPTLVGLSPTGRATIHVLGINRDFRIALRRSLIREGVFP